MITLCSIISITVGLWFLLAQPHMKRTPSDNEDVRKLVHNILHDSFVKEAFIPLPIQQQYEVFVNSHRIDMDVYWQMPTWADMARVRHARKARIRQFIDEENIKLRKDLIK